LRANLERGVYGPLSSHSAALTIDTSDFGRVDEQRLLQAIRAAASAAS